MLRHVNPRKVARLQARALRRAGASEDEVRRYRPILTAQVGQESNFTEGIGSPAGAQDIAQFMPATARSYGVRLHDNNIHDDIRGQIRYMLPLLRRYGVEDALRGYNAGTGAIARSHGFAETNNYVATITAAAKRYQLPNLAGAGGRGQAVRIPGRVGAIDPGIAPTGTPPSTATDARQAMLDSLLDPRKGMSLLDRFQERVKSGQYTTVTPATINGGQMPKYTDPMKGLGHGQPGAPTGAVGQGGGIGRIVAQANKIDAAQVPYLWGGGHQRRIGRGEKVTPMDCSGAVSRLLGLNPMVASQFMKWGRKGRDPRGRFTVWAASDHVLVEIAGHFWGTSGSNPGGGAGWIPSSAISKAYLSRFTPRHF
jgi:Transglycosylase SLT domain